MKKAFCIALLCLSSALPAAAQDDDGAIMMERGAREFLEGLMREMEPAWREMQEFLEEMGPAFVELMDDVSDWSVYEAPEILENGDIIIRRKLEEPDEPEPEPVPDPLSQIEI